MDKDEEDQTSKKLRTHVLYLETNDTRYQVSREMTEDYKPVFKVASVKAPYSKT
jgi:hypothetical protein